jgi:hypothetical protein
MDRLHHYLDHGIPELDDNAAERGMRAGTPDPKDYLTVGSEAGNKAAVIAHTPQDRAAHGRVRLGNGAAPVMRLCACATILIRSPNLGRPEAGYASAPAR